MKNTTYKPSAHASKATGKPEHKTPPQIPTLDALKQENNRQKQEIDLLKNIITLMPAYVYWIGTDGRYLGCNDLYAQSVGLTCRQDIVGKTHPALPWNPYPHLEPDALDAIHQPVIQTGETLTVEEPAIMPDGTQKTFLSTKSPLKNAEGEMIGMVVISVDITERKDLERALSESRETARIANRAKSDFLDRLHQDIRTPMQSIGELASMLEQFSVTRIPKHLARTIKFSTQALLKFFDGVLEAIRIGSGNLPGLRQKFSLHQILNSVLEMLRATAREKRTIMQYEYDEDVPEFMMGDPIRLYRVLMELLLNAVKFTEKGCVQTFIRITSVQGNDLVLEITIEDTGIGIPPDRHAEIFTRFSKFATGQASYQNLCKGAGMGLFIAKRFIEEMGGEIHYDPQYTTGARFIFLIPVSRALSQNDTGSNDTHFKARLAGRAYQEPVRSYQEVEELCENVPPSAG